MKVLHISEIVLRNFKSVVDESIALGRLTLLTGENSSGKSSILQVLRLLQQSLEESEDDRFPLNGDFIRMGTIKDIRNKDSKESNVSFGVKVETTGKGISSTYWGIDINKSVQYEPGSTYIQGLNIVSYDDSNDSKIRLMLDRRGTKKIIPVHYNSDPFSFDIRTRVMRLKKAEANTAFTGKTSFSTKRVSGLVLEGPLPGSKIERGFFITVKEVAKFVFAEEWLYQAIINTETRIAQNRRKELGRKVGKSIVLGRKVGESIDEESIIDKEDDLVKLATDDITKCLETHGLETHELSLESLEIEHRNQLGEGFLETVKDKRQHFIKKIAGNLTTGLKRINVFETRHLNSFSDFYNLNYSLRQIDEFISGIKYLGPLRKEPQFVTVTSPRSFKGDIGSKGEFTAAVLRSYGKTERKFPLPPPNSDTDIVSLDYAIQEWARYLKLARHIRVQDHGAYGTSLGVLPYGFKDEDTVLPLTFVGVGVSQVLPVLAICLLAEESIILLEQPELHLHPAMQLCLADFFIAISRFTDNQLIVETHSEYIISRLRRRIVEEGDGDDDLMKLVKVIFAKREEGATKYIPITLTPDGDIEGVTLDGDIEEEPEGFFDQAVEEEREIIRLAIEKATESASDLPEDG